MNHRKFAIKGIAEWSNNESNKYGTEGHGVFQEQLQLTTKNYVSRKIKNGVNHDDIYNSKDSVWAKFELIVIEIYSSPGVDIGNSGVKIEGVFGVLDDVDIGMIRQIASALKIIFTGGGDKKKSEY